MLLKPELGDCVLDWLDVRLREGVSVAVTDGVKVGEGVKVELGVVDDDSEER